MEITEEANTVVDIEPAEEAKDNEQEPMLEESTVDCVRSSTPCTPSFTCVRKCEESCVPVPNTYIPKSFEHLDEHMIIIAARQKLCNVHSVHNSPCQSRIELLPMLDSKETTEGTEEYLICRICHTRGEEALITPCNCKGSTQFVHETCLLTWFKKSVKNHCELCQQFVPIKKKRRPLLVWKRAEDRPVPLIWFAVFFIGLCLNILSIQVNASERCKSTACLIFYVVNGFGILLDAAFLWFWWIKCWIYLKKWCAINQDWVISDDKSGSSTILPALRRRSTPEQHQSLIEIVSPESPEASRNAPVEGSPEKHSRVREDMV